LVATGNDRQVVTMDLRLVDDPVEYMLQVRTQQDVRFRRSRNDSDDMGVSGVE